jgi:hypothetical protein
VVVHDQETPEQPLERMADVPLGADDDELAELAHAEVRNVTDEV